MSSCDDSKVKHDMKIPEWTPKNSEKPPSGIQASSELTLFWIILLNLLVQTSCKYPGQEA